MDVRSMRNAVLGARVVNALKSRNMDAYYVETKEEAVKKLNFLKNPDTYEIVQNRENGKIAKGWILRKRK